MANNEEKLNQNSINLDDSKLDLSFDDDSEEDFDIDALLNSANSEEEEEIFDEGNLDDPKISEFVEKYKDSFIELSQDDDFIGDLSFFKDKIATILAKLIEVYMDTEVDENVREFFWDNNLEESSKISLRYIYRELKSRDLEDKKKLQSFLKGVCKHLFEDLQKNIESAKNQLENSDERIPNAPLSSSSSLDPIAEISEIKENDLQNVDVPTKETVEEDNQNVDVPTVDLAEESRDHHPMSYLIKHFDELLNLNKISPEDVSITSGENTTATAEFNNQPYGVGDNSSLAYTWEQSSLKGTDTISAKENNGKGGCDFTISHPQKDVVSNDSIRATIDATVKYMNNQYKDNDDYKGFTFSINTQTPAFQFSVAQELFKYTPAYAQENAETASFYAKQLESIKNFKISGAEIDKNELSQYKSAAELNEFLTQKIKDAKKAEQLKQAALQRTQVQAQGR